MENDDLVYLLRSMNRMVFFVTDEEDKFLSYLADNVLKKYKSRFWVYNTTLGLILADTLFQDWKTRSHTEDPQTMSMHDALIRVYKDDPGSEQNFYVITDPERVLNDAQAVRRLLNIIHQGQKDNRVIKTIIFVGPRKVVPEKLARYIEVVYDKGLSPTEIQGVVEEATKYLQIKPPEDTANLFKGLTTYEISTAICQSIITTKSDPGGKRIEPKVIAAFRKRQLRKTDLVQQIDVAGFSFDQVGGASRFKAWAEKTRSCWTPEGQKFGLKPPKGVLCVGVWGCGKSLSVKAMGHAWKLPVISLEMGKLRSSGVGDSEANVYKVMRIIEAAAPCIVWIDEAEKSLSGGASSGQTDAGTTSRMIGLLSTWLQETTLPICLALTANSLKTLPIEFVNRMDERFFFDLPSEEDRIDILKIHLTKAGQDPTDYNLAVLSEAAKLMVGREIEQTIGRAMLESFAAKKSGLDEEILARELRAKSRIVKTMVDEVREVLDWVGYDAEVDDGIRARFAGKPNHTNGTLALVASDG